MTGPIKHDLQKELRHLRQQFSTIEAMLAGQDAAGGRRNSETDLNSVVSDLTYSLITSNASLAGIADIVLNYAKVFTGSEFGYVSSIDTENGDNLCHTLTGMMGDSCQIPEYEKGIVFPIKPDGRYPALWGHCLNTRQAFFTNTPTDHPAAIGTPDRHVPLFNFLSVPALIGSRLFGQISLANTPGGYTDHDLEGVKRLAAVYALAIQREQVQAALDQETARRQKLEASVRAHLAGTGELLLPDQGSDGQAPSEAEELNTALRVLLEQRDAEKHELELKVVRNVEKLIKPYIDKLQQTPLDSKQSALLTIIETNLEDIISPFVSRVTAKNVCLTPQEIQVANLVRMGHQSKEISAVLGVSFNAVNFHRKNIRAKLGLKHGGINLRSYLLTLPEL
jgi:DNA-binding CsgD family transcriptional regulator